MNTTKQATNRRRATTVAGAVGCLILLGAGCSKTEPTTTAATTTAAAGASTTASTSANSSTTAGGAASDPASTVTVKLFMFKPSPLTVKAGTKVTWNNGDDATHEPASGTDAAPTTVFDVTLEGKDTSGSFTFDKAGTYDYYCKIHTSMKGQIVVT